MKHDSVDFSQVFEMVDLGLVILKPDLTVCRWNRWMQLHSGISPEQIHGREIFEVFPNLEKSRFLRNCRTVLAFGNFCFFSPKLHHYLFPFKPISAFGSEFSHMQQSCTMGPLRDTKGRVQFIFIAVHDVTETVAFERRLMELNMVDALTEVHNRRSFETHLKREVDRHIRYKNPLSLIMFDIDHFKHINDTYGHQCGDYILKTLAGSIRDSIRTEDILCRYGGEEFCCLLPETPLNAAFRLAERFRAKVADSGFDYKEHTIPVTVSLGVATMNPETTTGEILVKKADSALYAAKRAGRNRTEVWSGFAYTD